MSAELVASLTTLGFEAPLLSSVQCSLAQSPDARGPFDVRVIAHLEGLLEAAMITFEELESNGSARKAKLQSDVDLASATLKATQEARDDGLIAESNSVVEVTTARETLASRSGDLFDFDRRAAETGLALNLAKETLDTFREDVLALFERLRSATSQEGVPFSIDASMLETPDAEQHGNFHHAEVETTGESVAMHVEQSFSSLSQSKILPDATLDHPLSVNGAMMGI